MTEIRVCRSAPLSRHAAWLRIRHRRRRRGRCSGRAGSQDRRAQQEIHNVRFFGSLDQARCRSGKRAPDDNAATSAQFALPLQRDFFVGLWLRDRCFSCALAVTGLPSECANGAARPTPRSSLISRFRCSPVALASLLTDLKSSVGTPGGVFLTIGFGQLLLPVSR